MSTVELEKLLLAAIQDINRDCTKCAHGSNHRQDCQGYHHVFRDMQSQCADWIWWADPSLKEKKV